MFLILELLFIVLLSMVLFMLYKNERASSARFVPHAKLEEYWNGSERRRCVRFQKDLEVNYLVEKKPHLKNGRSIDISEGGLKLLLDEKPAVGTILDLKITLPGSKEMAEIEGEVALTEEAKRPPASGTLSDKRKFHVGVRFLTAKGTSARELAKYIGSVCADMTG